MSTVDAPDGALPLVQSRVEIDGLPGGPTLSLVLAVEGDLVCLDRPMMGGRPVTASEGRPLELAYAVRKVPHTISLRVVSPPADGNAKGIWTKMTGAPVRHQRRGDFRVRHALPVVARELDDEGEPTGDPIQMTTVDISASGAQVLVGEPHDTGTLLSLILALPDDERPVSAVGRVYRVLAPEGDDGSRPRLGLGFEEIEPEDKERLRRVLLDVQRTQRRRELGLD